MSRWASVFSRRGGRPGPADGGPSRASAAPPVEDVDGVLLLRSVDDGFPSLAEMAEVAHAIRTGSTREGEESTTTVMVGVPAQDGAGAAEHWGRLAALLDRLREQGTTRVRLALSGAGHDRPESPSMARRIADAWEMEVLAPDGAVLITPGGVLFVKDSHSPPAAGGWWRFAPGAAPRPLGLRAPVPAWQEAFTRLPARTSGGCVVHPIPAGMAVRPAQAPRPDAGDLPFAVPVHPQRPVVLVGGPYAEDVAAEEVAAVLAALPAPLRSRVLLAPGGRRDLLRLGQSVADMLGGEVEVLTGIPLSTGDARAGGAVRPTLIGTGGELTWQPLVTAVMCAPAGADGRPPVPRPLHSHSPLPGTSLTAEGTVRLTDRWKVAPTRAGVAVVLSDAPSPSAVAHPVDHEAFVVELGACGEPLDDSLLPALSRLLTELGPQLRARTTLVVCGRLDLGERALREVAARHKVAGIRYVTRRALPGPRPAGPVPALALTRGDAQAVSRPRALTGTDTPASARTPAQPAQSAQPARPPQPARPAQPPAQPARDGAGRQEAEEQPVTAAPVSSAPAHAESASTRAKEPEPSQDGVEEPVSSAGTGMPRTPASSSDPATAVSSDPAAASSSDPAVTAEPRPAPQPPQAPGPAMPVAPTSSSRRAPAPGTAPEPVPGPEPEPGPEPAPAPPPAPPPAHPPAPAPAPVRAAPGTSAPAVPAVSVPLAPGHVSSASERAAFRALTSGEWEHHSAAVVRWLTRMPALRSQGLEAAREDLIAVHAYLTAQEGAALHHGALAREMRAGESGLLPYAACLASALRRLPSYRGVAVRGADALEGAPDAPEAGALLVQPGPVSALALPPVRPDGPATRYAIWSVTGRKVRHLLDALGSGASPTQEEIVFAPGTGFRVLGTREVHGSPVILLRELPGSAATWTDSSEALSGLDRSALDRLEKALKDAFAGGPGPHWPQRCTGPVGPAR
ncbi:hypothetical protein [Streptomyces sp. WG7]|uniref:hypothetical protein n=1 Tax=Streptomyces sp. WG7 TaxID=3417650 RepID=UPI003CFBB250